MRQMFLRLALGIGIVFSIAAAPFLGSATDPMSRDVPVSAGASGFAADMLASGKSRWAREAHADLSERAAPVGAADAAPAAAGTIAPSRRRAPQDPVTTGGSTFCPAQVTTCPVDHTQCPAQATVCPDQTTICPVHQTVCVATQCPVNPTYCPEARTVCQATVCPVQNTICPTNPTVCPVAPTSCPLRYTQCPANETFCPAQTTVCPHWTTRCPNNPTVCEYTVCPAIQTLCPRVQSTCPSYCGCGLTYSEGPPGSFVQPRLLAVAARQPQLAAMSGSDVVTELALGMSFVPHGRAH